MPQNIEVVLVDIGNTQIKSTIVSNGQLGETEKWDSLERLFDSFKGQNTIISSTRRLNGDFERKPNVLLLSHLTPLPITLDYKTPETLGVDRIAAAVGAFDLFPNENNLIVDVGTCMTIDLVDSRGVFQGGIISPGLRMRMKSMADYTDRLPDISSEWQTYKSSIPGKSTKECLFHGSFTGILNEINGVIQTLEKDFTSLNIIITGGDAQIFESTIKAHIFAGSKIVQQGLYQIWKYQ